MDAQAIDDLFAEYAVLSTEVEQGRIADDAPKIVALLARMSAALGTPVSIATSETV